MDCLTMYRVPLAEVHKKLVFLVISWEDNWVAGGWE